MSREELFSMIEALRARIDAEMEILEQMEEEYYSGEE